MAFYLHRSNRLEALVDALAEVVACPLGSPLDPEVIAVPTRGLERYVAMGLADRIGVHGAADFPFPRRLVERAQDLVLGAPDPAAAAYEPEALRWAVAARLAAVAAGAGGAPLRAYLTGSDGPRRRFELAGRLATLFDHYAVYRPELLATWQHGGEPTDWQAELWRALAGELGPAHAGARADAFFRAFAALGDLPARFPRRLSFFGVSTLPPLYVRILGALSRRLDVHLFVPSPCREYWGDVRRASRFDGTPEAPADAGAAGHPLLASLGRLGREFHDVLLETLGDADLREDERPIEPGTDTRLHALQSAMLNLRPAGPAPLGAPTDASVAIHVCHGPQREVEVLHDQLLALFEADSSLRPSDVVVLVPHIDAYAPYVEAVFGGSPAGEPGFLPFHIADRGAVSEDEPVAAFGALLDALTGRLSVTSVIDLIARPSVQRRLGLAGPDGAWLRRAVAAAGVRWGVDATHRASLGLPAFGEFSWRFGLDRLLVGYALPGSGPRLWQGVLPFDDLEGHEAAIVGVLADFCTLLFSYRAACAAERTPAEWVALLQAFADATLPAPDPRDASAARVREALVALRLAAERGRFAETVPFDVVRVDLSSRLSALPSARGFQTGGITFGELRPMRAVPFRVVCLLGMNDDAFPRGDAATTFDRLASAPRPGDRSAREEDRYLFLEILLAARERLFITYVGQDLQDNRPRPPSVVVSELFDALADGPPGAVPTAPVSGDAADTAEALRRALVVRHPLQPFSPRYFGGDPDPRLFSYQASFLAGARTSRGTRQPARPFFAAPLPTEAAGGPAEARLADVVRFFQNPARALLVARLGLLLEDDEVALTDREPVLLAPLERHALGLWLLRQRLAGHEPHALLPAARAAGLLPPGAPGGHAFAQLLPEVDALAAQLAAWAAGPRLEPFALDLACAALRLRGTLGDVWSRAQVHAQYARTGPGKQLACWIAHLALNCAAPPGFPRTSVLVGRAPRGSGARTVVFAPVPAAAQHLETLLRLYVRGQCAPLPLFPRASCAYAEALAAGESADRALGRARAEFATRPFASGEGDDPYVARAFAGHDPLAARATETGADAEFDFAAVAAAVFAPLIAHRQEAAE